VNTQAKTNLPVVLFNGTVATTNGVYSIKDIDVEKAKEYVNQYGFESAIGHSATAQVISNLLEQDVKVNRIQYHQVIGQIGIALKLNERPPEGNILTRDEMKEIGYSLKIIERHQ